MPTALQPDCNHTGISLGGQWNRTPAVKRLKTDSHSRAQPLPSWCRVKRNLMSSYAHVPDRLHEGVRSGQFIISSLTPY